jgi:hypothetical protein
MEELLSQLAIYFVPPAIIMAVLWFINGVGGGVDMTPDKYKNKWKDRIAFVIWYFGIAFFIYVGHMALVGMGVL